MRHGLVAARIVALVLILQQIPAFAIDIVCCSIASWTEPLSSGLINENSSIQQTPQSARTSAPASRIQSFPSLNAATVSPAEVVPIPEVLTDLIEIFYENCRSWDFPVPGSPIIRQWIWPLIGGSSPHFLGTPPIIASKMPNFSAYRSYKCGAIDSRSLFLPSIGLKSCSFQYLLNSLHAYWLISCLMLNSRLFSTVILLASTATSILGRSVRLKGGSHR